MDLYKSTVAPISSSGNPIYLLYVFWSQFD